ncbi:glycosyltransferase family 2 protein [Compostimonas suwonensis]|uniref:Glycosyltransferase involved in cell wall biosynthesis n=1 Tax=Compostimonas suwonensis TaxID=1048394 RepID=A0A2M9BUV2_9MICO|nr:glycosyltransferase [Compostimonas suwonensis]PJJ61728.1 glycosyltransferase involved in cell wall biosynthesis [Compostimonas suwonensis]
MTVQIVMPFYGRVDHFRLAVESVLAQSDPDWRLLIIDDAYPDPEPQRWATALGDPRVSYRRNPENLGINANFQASVDAATEEWVTIFGCDDIMLPGYVARVKALAERHPDAAFIHPGTRVIDEAGVVSLPLVDRVKGWYRPRFRGTLVLSGQRLAVSITRGNWMNFPAIAWRREPLQSVGFRPRFQIVQDLALAIDLALRGGSLVLDDELVFEYRRHASSVSSWRASDGSRFVEEREFFVAEAARFREHGWTTAARVARVHLSSRVNALTRLPVAIRSGNGRAMRGLLRHAFGA